MKYDATSFFHKFYQDKKAAPYKDKIYPQDFSGPGYVGKSWGALLRSNFAGDLHG